MKRKRRFGEFNYWIFVSIWVLTILLLIGLLGCATSSYDVKAKAYLDQGYTYLGKGQYDLAIENYKKALEIAPSVETSVGKGQYDLAIENYKKALEIGPSVEARFFLGFAYYCKGQYGLAIENYKKALEIVPSVETPVEPHYVLGLAYYQNGQYDLALDNFNKSLEIAWLDFIHIAATNANNPFEIPSYEEWPEKSPKLADFYFFFYWQLGVHYRARDQYDLAIDILKKGLEIGPREIVLRDIIMGDIVFDLDEFYLDLGRAYAGKGQYDLAVDNFKKCLEADSDNDNDSVYSYLGDVYYVDGQYDLAVDSYKKFLEIHPGLPSAHWDLGKVYDAKGQYELAIESFKKAVEIEPAFAKRYANTSKIPFYEEYPSQKIVQPDYTAEDPEIKQVREAYAQIDEIKGAIYDEENNWPIFFGTIKEQVDSESLMNLDELIMCMKVIQSREDPGVSIEPPEMTSPLMALPTSIPDYQTVRYIPESIKGTQLGKKVFEADRALKGLGFGKDPITHREVSSKVYGYKTLPELARQLTETKAGYFGRIWFKPKEVSLKRGENIVVFDRIPIKVESESPYPTPAQFASNFEKHYAQFSLAFPIYKDLIRIGKEVAIARWLRGKGHRLDLKDYRMQPVYTSSKTDTLLGRIPRWYTIEEGKIVYRYVSGDPFLAGGVIYDTRNQYEYSPSLRDVKNLILNAK